MEGYHEYWAPCMHYADGWYYLYFSCMPVGAEVAQEHLRVAKAPTPFGPFENVKCLYDDFSIDAHVVKTDAGLYLWYAMDNTDCERVGTRIVVDKLLDRCPVLVLCRSDSVIKADSSRVMLLPRPCTMAELSIRIAAFLTEKTI